MKRKRDSNEIDVRKEDDRIASRKEMKAKVHSINSELAELARKKHLKQALKCFNTAISNGCLHKHIHVFIKLINFPSLGIPLDTYSYTNILNAYVRCGELQQALIWMKQMQSNNIPSNIVTYTTLLKGCCEAGLLVQASEIFFHNILALDTIRYRILLPTIPSDVPLCNPSENAVEINIRALNTYLR